jgi:hypothetical protein
MKYGMTFSGSSSNSKKKNYITKETPQLWGVQNLEIHVET